MQPTKIVFFSVGGSDDVAVSLKNAIGANPSFHFELKEKALGIDQLTNPSRIPVGFFSQWRPNLAVLDLPENRREEAEAFLGIVQRQLEGVPIVIFTRTSEPRDLCRWLELGVADFITPPLRPVDILPRFWKLHNQASGTDPVVAGLKERLGLKQLVGESPALLSVIAKIPAVAKCDATVLITGETGTGKEMFARAIHHLSRRSDKPFVPVNCGAIPVDLLENELFGHEPGAFTGAHSSAVGLLQKTDGGTLFLDEVDCLPLMAQVKLLRFLQEKEFRPLGANKACRVDVRVVAASNANLDEAVRKGRLREDIYFRLNVISLSLPPLRARKEDIALMARHFIAKYAASFGAPTRDLTASALQKLMLHDWPGNVRELENVIERSVVLSSKCVLNAEDIQLNQSIPIAEGECFQTLKAKLIAQFERAYILDLLRNQQGNITRAATVAGKNRRAFWELMRKHDIHLQRPVESMIREYSAPDSRRGSSRTIQSGWQG